MSCTIFGGRPLRGGGGFIGLFAVSDATMILKINDIYLPMFIFFVWLPPPPPVS
jgi:hypothetical protein